MDTQNPSFLNFFLKLTEKIEEKIQFFQTIISFLQRINTVFAKINNYKPKHNQDFPKPEPIQTHCITNCSALEGADSTSWPLRSS